MPLNFLVTSSIRSLPGGVLRAVEDPYQVTKIVQKIWPTWFLMGEILEGCFWTYFHILRWNLKSDCQNIIPSWDINLVDFGCLWLYQNSHYPCYISEILSAAWHITAKLNEMLQHWKKMRCFKNSWHRHVYKRYDNVDTNLWLNLPPIWCQGKAGMKITAVWHMLWLWMIFLDFAFYWVSSSQMVQGKDAHLSDFDGMCFKHSRSLAAEWHLTHTYLVFLSWEENTNICTQHAAHQFSLDEITATQLWMLLRHGAPKETTCWCCFIVSMKENTLCHLEYCVNWWNSAQSNRGISTAESWRKQNNIWSPRTCNNWSTLNSWIQEDITNWGAT